MWRALKRPLDVCFEFGLKKRPSGPTPARQPASWPTTEPSLRTSNKLLRLSSSFSRLWLLDFQMKCINCFNLKKRTLNHWATGWGTELSVEENFFFSFLAGGSYRKFQAISAPFCALRLLGRLFRNDAERRRHSTGVFTLTHTHINTHTLMQSATMMCREGRKSDFTEWALVDRANDLPWRWPTVVSHLREDMKQDMLWS